MIRFGVGPRILVSALAYGALAGWVTSRWPNIFTMKFIPELVTNTIAVILIAIGVPMLVVSARAMNAAFKKTELVTTGIFGIVRNPIYSAWIVFIIPGMGIYARSWPGLLTPFVAYLAFKLSIRQEEEYLEERFGQEYREYRARVCEVIPWPGSGRRSTPR